MGNKAPSPQMFTLSAIGLGSKGSLASTKAIANENLTNKEFGSLKERK